MGRIAAMKTSLLILVSLLVAAGSLRADSFLKATVTGTIQTQKVLSPLDGRIQTSILNDKFIFEEFQVSKTDYELVLDASGSGELLLLPKHSGGALSAISVAKIGSIDGTAIDTKARVEHLVGPADPGSATNLFKDLAGTFNGTAHYTGMIGVNTVVTKYILNFTGSGRGGAILKFKVTGAGQFEQAP
jgi:hypothetical protein